MSARIIVRPRGAIAQLGERIVRNDEVVGSIPTSSTMFSISYNHPLANSCPKLVQNLTDGCRNLPPCKSIAPPKCIANELSQ